MGFGDKCCVGGCKNDRRYPKKWVIHSHVEKLSFHKPKQSLIEAWSRQVQKGRKDFSIGKSRESVDVCSNRFRDRKPSVSNPIPTLFLLFLRIQIVSHPKSGVDQSIKRRLQRQLQPSQVLFDPQTIWPL